VTTDRFKPLDRRAVGISQDGHRLLLVESALPHGLLPVRKPSSRRLWGRRSRTRQLRLASAASAKEIYANADALGDTVSLELA
jgi:hypothetical protein